MNPRREAIVTEQSGDAKPKYKGEVGAVKLV